MGTVEKPLDSPACLEEHFSWDAVIARYEPSIHQLVKFLTLPENEAGTHKDLA